VGESYRIGSKQIISFQKEKTMRRHHPDHQMDIPISLKVYHQLIGAAQKTGYQKEDWEIAAEAIDEWMRRHAPDALAMSAATGYQWKNLFLPNGTLLRTVFGGKNHHCLVEGDRILYNGQAVSPTGFANAVGGIRRNAWRSIWILFPDSKDWKLADTLRIRERPRRARKPMAGIQPPPAADPLPAQMACAAASKSEAPGVPHAIDGQSPRNNPRGERRNRPPTNGVTHSPPGFMYGTDRRMHGDARMTALLRQELLPLLYRMCALDGTAS
jgi:hypothetical protein